MYKRDNQLPETILFVSAALRAAFYIIIGSLILYHEIMDMSPYLRIPLGILMIAYGIFRGYRGYSRWKTPV